MACLKEEGKVASEMQRLRRVVIGRRRESRHCLRRKVGRISRGQVELDEERIRFRTSSGVVEVRRFKVGGGTSGKR